MKNLWIVIITGLLCANLQAQTVESNAPEPQKQTSTETNEPTTQPTKTTPKIEEAEEAPATSSEETTEPYSGGLNFNPRLTPKVQDGAYERITHYQREALPLPHIREADVSWSKRIWRVIDTQEKINIPFVSEYNPLIEVLLEVADKNKEVELYTDDSFTEVLAKSDVAERLEVADSTEVYNFETDDYEMIATHNELDLTTFDKFRVKEDWIFDTKTSQMVCRIVGIAPIRKVVDSETGLVRGNEVLFWIHYPSVRPFLTKYEAYNPYNDAITISWSHMFDGRLFSSYIIKESNPLDRDIEDYMAGRDALKESEEIKGDILNRELDLWSY